VVQRRILYTPQLSAISSAQPKHPPKLVRGLAKASLQVASALNPEIRMAKNTQDQDNSMHQNLKRARGPKTGGPWETKAGKKIARMTQIAVGAHAIQTPFAVCSGTDLSAVQTGNKEKLPGPAPWRSPESGRIYDQ